MRIYYWVAVCCVVFFFFVCLFFFVQAEDGIRDLVRSRGLGDVYKRQRERSSSFGAGSFGVSRLRKIESFSHATLG